MIQPFYHALLGILLTYSLCSQAKSEGIKLGQTRVIFSSEDKAQSFIISNTGKQAYLIQTRVQKELNDTTSAPFIVTPPLFSLQANSRQVLRILPQGLSLPSDRESLFYITVSAIPAQSDPITFTDRLSVGVRFMIKMFYRPYELIRDNSSCLLKFKSEPQIVRIINPSGFFQTMGTLSFDERLMDLDPQTSMVPPYSSITLPIDRIVNEVVWQNITDYGGLSDVCHQKNLHSMELIP